MTYSWEHVWKRWTGIYNNVITPMWEHVEWPVLSVVLHTVSDNVIPQCRGAGVMSVCRSSLTDRWHNTKSSPHLHKPFFQVINTHIFIRYIGVSIKACVLDLYCLLPIAHWNAILKQAGQLPAAGGSVSGAHSILSCHDNICIWLTDRWQEKLEKQPSGETRPRFLSCRHFIVTLLPI